MENLLNVSDMAKLLKKSEVAVRVLRQRGVLPTPVKVGRSIYWRESDIKAMLVPESRGRNGKR